METSVTFKIQVNMPHIQFPLKIIHTISNKYNTNNHYQKQNHIHKYTRNFKKHIHILFSTNIEEHINKEENIEKITQASTL